MEDFVENGTEHDTDMEAKAELDIKIAEMKQRDAEEVSEKQAIAKMYRMMGRIEAGEFYRKFIDVTTLHFYKQVKEQKLYKKIPRIGTWENFCKQIAGCSRDKIDKDLINLNELGPEFYESANQLGIGYRDFRKLRKLPDGDRQELLLELEKKEVKKEEFLELLEQSFEEKAKVKTEKDELERRFEKKEEEHAKELVDLTVERDHLKKLVGENATPEAYLELFVNLEHHMTEATKIVASMSDEVLREDFNVQLRANQAITNLETIIRNLSMRIADAQQL